MAERIFYVNVNVSSMDKSIAFYELIGFKLLYRMTPDRDNMKATARIYGEAPNEDVEVAFMRFGDDPMQTCLDLCEWKTRPGTGTPPKETNHLGMCRLSINVDDPDAVVARLNAAGYKQVGEKVEMVVGEGNPPSTFVAFRDPDGVFIQLVSKLDQLVA